MECSIHNNSKKQDKKEIVCINGVSETATEIVRKSNALIMKVGKTTLLSEKIFLYALKVVQRREGQMEGRMPIDPYYADIYQKTNTNFAEGLISEISSTELRSALKNKNGSYYDIVDRLMNEGDFCSNWNILYKDKDIIGSTAVIMGTLYDRKRGKILIKWNADIEHLIYNLSGNYTELNEKVMYGFKHLYSYNLYQLLRSGLSYQQAIDRKRGYNIDHEYELTYELSELKFLIGVLNINPNDREPGKGTQKVVKLIKAQNFSTAEEILQESSPSMPRYIDMKRYAIAKAYLEINGFTEDANDTEETFLRKVCENSKTDLHFRYKPLKKGRGGKVYAVSFIVGWNSSIKREKDILIRYSKNNVMNIVEPDAAKIMELVDEAADIIPVTLKPKEYKAILKAANYNIALVDKAVSVLKQKNNVKDVVAFLTAAIKEDYESPTPYQNEENSFHNFHQREYDYDQLEIELLKN